MPLAAMRNDQGHPRVTHGRTKPPLYNPKRRTGFLRVVSDQSRSDTGTFSEHGQYIRLVSNYK